MFQLLSLRTSFKNDNRVTVRKYYKYLIFVMLQTLLVTGGSGSSPAKFLSSTEIYAQSGPTSPLCLLLAMVCLRQQWETLFLFSVTFLFWILFLIIWLMLQEGAILMDHHLLFMTRSSSTTKSLTNGHLQEECQQQEMIMHSLYFPPLEISAAPKSLL